MTKDAIGTWGDNKNFGNEYVYGGCDPIGYGDSYGLQSEGKNLHSGDSPGRSITPSQRDEFDKAEELLKAATKGNQLLEELTKSISNSNYRREESRVLNDDKSISRLPLDTSASAICLPDTTDGKYLADRTDNYIIWMDLEWNWDERGPCTFRSGIYALASLMIHEAVHARQKDPKPHECEIAACEAQLEALDAIEEYRKANNKLTDQDKREIEDMRYTVMAFELYHTLATYEPKIWPAIMATIGPGGRHY